MIIWHILIFYKIKKPWLEYELETINCWWFPVLEHCSCHCHHAFRYRDLFLFSWIADIHIQACNKKCFSQFGLVFSSELTLISSTKSPTCSFSQWSLSVSLTLLLTSFFVLGGFDYFGFSFLGSLGPFFPWISLFHNFNLLIRAAVNSLWCSCLPTPPIPDPMGRNNEGEVLYSAGSKVSSLYSIKSSLTTKNVQEF